MTVVVQWCNYILPICLNLVTYMPHNTSHIMHVHVLNQWKWKFVLIVLLLHGHVLILDFFKE